MSLIASAAAFVRRLRLLAARDRTARDLESEMRLHLDLRSARYQRDGLSRADADAAARRRFGNPVALQERSRDAWGFRWIEQLGQDVRYGARMLRRGPGFALIAIGAIGIAVGINAGFFTLFDALAWQPLPVANPARLVRVQRVDARHTTSIWLSDVELARIQSGSRTLEDVVGYSASPIAVKLSASAPAVVASIGLVSSNYFTALGGVARVGRALRAEDDRVDASPAVVISDRYWTNAFARAPDIVGRDIVVNGAHVAVVGVVDSTFVGPNPLVPDMWMTFAQGEAIGATPGKLLDPKNRFIVIHARLRRNYTMAQSAAELSGLIAEPPVPEKSPDAESRIIGAALQPSESMLPPNTRVLFAFTPALFVVGLVLVIACANLANLLLSRALVRRREIAVRLAVGASRGRLIRQLLTESLIIAASGAILGFVLSRVTVALISRSYFSFVPSTYGTLVLSLHSSWRVVTYTVLLAGVSAVTFGLAPALHATSLSLSGMLKGDDSAAGGRIRRSRIRDALIVAQVAGSVVLVVAAVILTRGVRELAGARTGLNVDAVAVASFGIAPNGKPDARLAAERSALADAVAHSPSVIATARVELPPFASWPLVRVRTAASVTRALPTNRVTPRYWDVVEQHLIAGRIPTAADSAANVSVAVVTQAAARALWPRAAAVGQALTILGPDGQPQAAVPVVGVVADARNGMLLDDDSDGYVYVSAVASDFVERDMPILVRGAVDVPALARELRDRAVAIDPSSPIDVHSLAAAYDQQVMPFRYAAGITAAIAALGLALAVVGLWGVVAFAVQQRSREIAVHVAMGARGPAVLRLVMRRELRLIAIGLGIGLLFGGAESALIDSLTLPLPALGPVGFGVVAVLLFAVGAAATAVPASRALRIAPMQVLRQE